MTTFVRVVGHSKNGLGNALEIGFSEARSGRMTRLDHTGKERYAGNKLSVTAVESC